MEFPSEVLLDFFRAATLRLDGSQMEEKSEISTAAGNERDRTPPSLEMQRQCLLSLQVDALRRAVEKYNEKTGARGVSLEDAQLVLREIGSNDFSHVDSVDEQAMNHAMDAMNDSARLAFARSVLMAEMAWECSMQQTEAGSAQLSNNRDLIDSSCDGGICRSEIIEFFGLCNAAVCLPEVQASLRDGSDMRIPPISHSSQNMGMSAEADKKRKSPQELLEILQHRIFRAVGYDPDFGSAEIRRMFFSEGSAEGDDSVDSELTEMFAKFLSKMSVAVTKATLAHSQLTDVEEGGVTRVVSVEYSEKFVGGEGGEKIVSAAPLSATMEEHSDAENMRQLAMAREAAVLQKQIIGELLSMDKDAREETLIDARKAHESFLRKALELPPGPERVAFLQNIDSKQQRLLAIHKLWGKMLAENGGEERTIVHK